MSEADSNKMNRASINDYMVRVRRHIHQFPELSFKEFETASFIESELRALGLSPRKVAETGVVADLEMARSGKTVAVRADIDALPVDEESGEPFASRNTGVMHACGHDAHAAMVLGLAKELAERKSELTGRVRLIFQPAEESPPGGALKLIEAGVLEGVDYIIGQHVTTDLTVGHVGINYGYGAAIADHFTVSFTGPGGHGARPYQTKDVLVVASAYVMLCQTIISRMIEASEPAVLTFGTFESGFRYNVIASKSELTGTVRAYNPAVRDLIRDRLRKTHELVCKIYECEGNFEYFEGYPSLLNDRTISEVVKEASEAVVGKEHVEFPPPTMGGEDFAYYLQRVKGTFFRLGVWNIAWGKIAGQHSPKHRVDERSLDIGERILFESFRRLSVLE